MIWFLLFACKEETEERSLLGYYIDEYHSLEEGASWTYRDDRVIELDVEPNESELLRARYEGDGIVAFRKGLRWSEATPVGEMSWGTEDFLVLYSWSLPGTDGAGEYPISGAEPEEGQQINSGDWSCVTREVELIETYYAQFDRALQFDCQDAATTASFVFAKETGLVQLSLDDYTLNLVAPW